MPTAKSSAIQFESWHLLQLKLKEFPYIMSDTDIYSLLKSSAFRLGIATRK